MNEEPGVEQTLADCGSLTYSTEQLEENAEAGFSGCGAHRNNRKRRFCTGIVQRLPVTLEELYKGARKVLREENIICDECGGRCIKIEKALQRNQDFDFYVERGMADGQKVVFNGDGDEEPDEKLGDLIIVLDEKEHDVFKRFGHDLITRLNIEMVEALCGFQRVIRTLDERNIVIAVMPGAVTKHGDLQCVLNEGMPMYKNPLKRGHLIIEFLVNFPTSVHHGVIPQIEYWLPLRPAVNIPEVFEARRLMELDPEQRRRLRHTRLGPAYDGGDHMIIVLDELEHGVFKRSGNDLTIRLDIELVEALCGFRKVIRTLDERDIVIEVVPGAVTKHGNVKCVLNEGLPIHMNTLKKGQLIVHFLVNFPTSIDPRVIPALADCLPRRPVVFIPPLAAVCHLTALDAEQEARVRRALL